LRRAVWLVLAMQAAVIGLVLALYWQPALAQPAEAQHYKLTLRREAQLAWGLQAPVATFAAQVHQESHWNINARSAVGAQGLAQFMPSTTQWIGGLTPSLGERAAYNPTWSLRALVTYDHWLAVRINALDECQRMAFALQAYNSGLGWVYKRQRLSPTPGQCLGAACSINPGVTPASQREAEGYPRLILQRWEPLYAGWGLGSCP
jgi:soluble lytic murein transglycosylase-like protein